MQLSRALFVLPTLFTLSSVLMGLISVTSAAEGNYRLSAITIFFAFLFDAIDGRVARLTRTQSKFGIQIDSLADVISFGVAPALLVYQALLRGPLGGGMLDLGLVVAFLYVAAGAVRLARYNVQAERKPGPVTMFTGLPIPAAAGCLAGMVFGLASEGGTLGWAPALAFLLLLAVLMVSTVKFRKKFNWRSPDTLVLTGLLLATLAVVAALRPSFALFAFYTAAGLVEGTLRRAFGLHRRLRANRRLRLHDRNDRNVR